MIKGPGGVQFDRHKNIELPGLADHQIILICHIQGNSKSHAELWAGCPLAASESRLSLSTFFALNIALDLLPCAPVKALCDFILCPRGSVQVF